MITYKIKHIFCLTAILLLLNLAVYSFQTKIELPKPTGKFSLGTPNFSLTDKSRKEIASINPNEFRQLQIQIWYPAKKTIGTSAIYFKNLESFKEILSEKFSQTLKNVRTNSFENAPISNKNQPYPVLFFSGGFGMSRFYYTSFFEELASHGFVVVAIDHPYLNLTSLENEQIINPKNSFWDSFPATKGIDSVMEGEKKLAFAFEYLSGDLLFVAKELKRLNSEKLNNRLNLKQFISLGHSAGSLATQGLLWKKSPFKAFVFYDVTIDRKAGSPNVTVIPSGVITKPALLFRLQYASQPKDDFADRIRQPFFDIQIEGAIHNSISDLPYLSAASNGDRNELEKVLRFRSLINEYTLSFLQKTLQRQKFSPNEKEGIKIRIF